MTIRELFARAAVTPDRHEGEAAVSSMTMDSRRVRPGSLFVCMPPANSKSRDSHDFLAEARQAGAESALVYSVSGLDAARRLGLAAVLLDPNKYKDSLWKLAKIVFGNPSGSMKVIGVTGTNGKTTTAWLVRDMFRALGVKTAYLGTLGFQLPGENRELNNTTPFSIELNELLAEARDRGVQAIAMEVSSHALAERRVDGIEFDAAVFTNLTQDHLDFHGSMAEYEAAKFRLFTDFAASSKKFAAAINVGDAAGGRLANHLGDSERTVCYRVAEHGDGGKEFVGVPLEIRLDHIRLRLHDGMTGETEFQASLGGSYNVENLLSASAALRALGVPLEEIGRVGREVTSVPGRFEAVPNDAGIGILVDYAHTPDALEKLLDAVRPLTRGRVITVFGCGGDRDRTKRPRMARAASERSDVTVVTSDNPRTEDPQLILDEVVSGIASNAESVAIIDRAEAISFAVGLVKPGDVVVIAGKGHENYQIIGRTKTPMDDRELARKALGAG